MDEFLKTPHILATAFSAAILCSIPMRADIASPYTVTFSGVCADCPAGPVTATFTQTGELYSDPMYGYGYTFGSLTYNSGWFSFSLKDVYHYYSGSSPFSLGSGDYLYFSGSGDVTSTQVTGNSTYCGGPCVNPYASGLYNVQLYGYQGGDWGLSISRPEEECGKDERCRADFGGPSFGGPGAGFAPGAPSAVPEPSTWAMFGTGAVALLVARRRRSNG